jgi:hypothetical protein
MAIDVYLQIDGIKGESADTAHKDWIEVKSVNWEVLQPKSATASTGGGTAAAELLVGQDPAESQAGVPARRWPGRAHQILRDRTGKRPDQQRRAKRAGGRHPDRASLDQVFEGALEVHPAESRRRFGRQHVRRLGPVREPDGLIDA